MRNPAGKAACVASHARWAARFGNVRFVLGTREKWQAAARSEEDFREEGKSRGAHERKFLWKCAPHVPYSLSLIIK
jgi:hypothetical protein